MPVHATAAKGTTHQRPTKTAGSRTVGITTVSVSHLQPSLKTKAGGQSYSGSASRNPAAALTSKSAAWASLTR